MHDLLFKTNENRQFINISSADDLKLKDIFMRFAGNKENCDHFINTLLNPCRSYENILYRRNILSTFLDSENMIYKLNGILESIIIQKAKNSEFKRILVYNDQFAAMQSHAITLQKLLALFKELANTAEKIKTRCIPINSLLDRIVYLGKNEDTDRISDICKTIISAESTDDCIMQIMLHDRCKIAHCDIINWVGENPKYGWIKKILTDDYAESNNWFDITSNFTKDAYKAAVKNITELLRDIEFSIYDEFVKPSRQLVFYTTAYEFIKHMKSKATDICFPKLSSKNIFAATNLKDVLLSIASDNITGYNISLCNKQNNMIIIGDNSSGKTVFLRAIATAQLMFQAGLPIAAHSAEIPLRSSIFTMFELSEEYSSSAKGIGHFEAEVKYLSEITDKTQDNSVIFFNEIFQSTDYEKGEAALYNILKAFEENNIYWAVVTHFPNLINMFDTASEKCTKIKMSENYTPTYIRQ